MRKVTPYTTGFMTKLPAGWLPYSPGSAQTPCARSRVWVPLLPLRYPFCSSGCPKTRKLRWRQMWFEKYRGIRRSSCVFCQMSTQSLQFAHDTLWIASQRRRSIVIGSMDWLTDVMCITAALCGHAAVRNAGLGAAWRMAAELAPAALIGGLVMGE